MISAYEYIGVNLNTRVDALFTWNGENQQNDFHAPDNFIWVPNELGEGVESPYVWVN